MLIDEFLWSANLAKLTNLEVEINFKNYLYLSCNLALHFGREFESIMTLKTLKEFYPGDFYVTEITNSIYLGQLKKMKKRESEKLKANQSL